MIYHGFCHASFICANIFPVPRGSKVNLSDSDKYRSIAISTLLGKILDHIIIVKQSDALTTSQHQYGFKANSSTVLYSTMVGYEPADLTVHSPPPPELSRVGSFFSYRCLVFPKKCPQRKACTFLSYSG